MSHALFHKPSLHHLLGHIISYLPITSIPPLTRISKPFYITIYSPHTLICSQNINKYEKLSLGNAAMARLYFAKMGVFHVDERHRTLPRRIFRCLLRRSTHTLRELHLLRCHLRYSTLCRILNECTALEVLVVRFVEWEGMKDAQRRDSEGLERSEAPRQDLSASMEFEEMLRVLEEPLGTSMMRRSRRDESSEESKPLSLDFHPDNTLQLKTLEIRNLNASQFDSDWLRVIAQCCETITELTLFGFRAEHMNRLMERIPKSNTLRRIHIGQVEGIRVEMLNHLAAHCLCLRKLKFTQVTYQGFVPSYPNDFAKFYSLERLNTIECIKLQGGSLTKAVLSMLPRHDTGISQFSSIAYHSMEQPSAGRRQSRGVLGQHDNDDSTLTPFTKHSPLPFDHISLRELHVSLFDETVRTFITRNLSYLTQVHIQESILAETDLQFILNCKNLQDVKLTLAPHITLSHLFGILSRHGTQFQLKKLSVHLGYPKETAHQEHLVDLDYQSMRQLHHLEVFGEFQVLPLCFCPELRHLSVNDMHFDDIHSLLMVLGHYNKRLETLELFSSNVVPVVNTEKAKSPPTEKQPLAVCFSARQVNIMVSSCHPHIYDMVRLLIHFPQASFSRLKFPVVYSRELCMPFVKHHLLPHALDSFKALVLWCLDQIASRELQLTSSTKEYIGTLIQLVDVFDPDSPVVELPLLPYLFEIFRKKFTFAPELPPFSPPRSLTRVVVFEKYRQFVQHIKRKQRSLLQVLEEFTV